MEDGDAAVLGEELLPDVAGATGVMSGFVGESGEEILVESDEFALERHSDLAQVGDHPAGIFEIPVVRQTDELPARGDVREEWELAATQGAVLALALGGSQAG